MEFGVLGPLQVIHAGRTLLVGGPQVRTLLAVLLVHANKPVATERLIHELWGDDPPPSARNIVQVHVNNLRNVLNRHCARPATPEVLTQAPGYLLRVRQKEIDAWRFERLVEEGRTALADGPAEAASHTLREALALWRGRAFEGFASESFAQGEAARLEELRLAAIEDRIDADLAAARHVDLAGELRLLVADYPLRERFRAQLMRALYAVGRQAEALEAFRECARAFQKELAVEPGPMLQDLHRAILQQDPSLDAFEYVGWHLVPGSRALPRTR